MRWTGFASLVLEAGPRRDLTRRLLTRATTAQSSGGNCDDVLNGKGRKQRWTAISEVALAALRTYLEDFRGWSEGHLFQTVDGRALRNHHMNVMFTRHGLRAGVSQVNPHRFRHTFATWAIRVNARELDVQYLLGHSSPMMVRRYSATYDSEQAAKAHAAFSPAMQL